MKKSLLLLSLSCALVAQTQGEISLTIGHNSFDNEDIFKSNKTFLGIRGGVRLDNCVGFHLGYEQASDVTCDDCGVKASRVYANVLKEFNIQAPITPYILAGLGYELLDEDGYGKDQLYGSIGIGAKYTIASQFGIFADTSFIQKFDSGETDFIARLGLSFRLNNTLNSQTTARYTQEPKLTTPQIDTFIEPIAQSITLDEIVDSSLQTIEVAKGNHYIQLMALAKSDPQKYIQKLNNRDIYNLEIKELITEKGSLSIIVAGPYMDRDSAKTDLPKLKRYSPNAFIKVFD